MKVAPMHTRQPGVGLPMAGKRYRDQELKGKDEKEEHVAETGFVVFSFRFSF
jgi:hypothetical protein